MRARRLFFSVVAVLSASSHSAFATTPTPTPNLQPTFVPVKDVEITNFVTSPNCTGDGSEYNARIGRTTGKGTLLFRYLLHFDISTIPANSTLQFAFLTFNVTSWLISGGPPITLEVRRITQPGWEEDGASWNYYDCDPDPQKALAWCRPGGDFSGDPSDIPQYPDGVTYGVFDLGVQWVDVTWLA